MGIGLTLGSNESSSRYITCLSSLWAVMLDPCCVAGATRTLPVDILLICLSLTECLEFARSYSGCSYWIFLTQVHEEWQPGKSFLDLSTSDCPSAAALLGVRWGVSWWGCRHLPSHPEPGGAVSTGFSGTVPWTEPFFFFPSWKKKDLCSIISC